MIFAIRHIQRPNSFYPKKSCAHTPSSQSSTRGSTKISTTSDTKTVSQEEPYPSRTMPGVLSAQDYGYDEASLTTETIPSSQPVYTKPGVLTAQDYGYGNDQSGGDTPMTGGPAARSTNKGRRSSMRQAGSIRRNSITPKGEVEITLPPTNQGEGHRRVTRRTSLTFKETTQVKTIEPAHHLGRKQDLWFQEEEMHQIRKKVAVLVRQTGDGRSSRGDGKKYCVRGLERLMDPESTSMKRGLAWDAVLNEQYLQTKQGVFAEDHIANLYKVSTMRSQNDAVSRGMEDEREVAKYLESTRRGCRRMSM